MPDKRKDDSSSSGSAAKKRNKTKNDSNSGGTSNRGARVEEILNADSEPFTYDPVHFIRSHSKNNDPADIQTQIWEVVFEPDPLDAEKTTTKVATCGGNSICIIDVNGGQVLMKYKHKELK